MKKMLAFVLAAALALLPGCNTPAAQAETSEEARACTLDLAGEGLTLDPRQEADFDLGMKYFFEAAGARYVFPMHMWGDYSVVPLFKSTPPYREYAQAVMDVSAPGQEFEVD